MGTSTSLHFIIHISQESCRQVLWWMLLFEAMSAIIHLSRRWRQMFLTDIYTVIPRLTKIIRSGIAFVSRNVISHRLSDVSLLAVSNVNPVGLVGLPYVMRSAHFFVTHIQTEKISSWNDPTLHVCCSMLARSSTKTLVSRIHIR
jgi:hypothetical protein